MMELMHVIEALVLHCLFFKKYDPRNRRKLPAGAGELLTQTKTCLQLNVS